WLAGGRFSASNQPPRCTKGPPRQGQPLRTGSDPKDQPSFATFSAAGPFWPCTMSNSTRSPSLRDLKPDPWIDEWWTKQSLSPPSGVMNPKPLASLNHFTVPVVRTRLLPVLFHSCRGPAQPSHPTISRGSQP